MWVGAQSAANAQRPPRRERAKLPRRCIDVQVRRPPPNSTAVQTGRETHDRVHARSSRGAPAICSAFAAPLCEPPSDTAARLHSNSRLQAPEHEPQRHHSGPAPQQLSPAQLFSDIRVGSSSARSSSNTARAAPRLPVRHPRTLPCWNISRARLHAETAKRG